MAKTRSKPTTEIKKITSLSEADHTLHKIADLRATIRQAEAEADIAVNAIKDKLKETCTPMLDEISSLEKSLAVYSEYNKEELFKDKKTIELTFGLFGFRKSTSISVKRDTIDLLKEHGFTDAIRLKETPNKEVLGEWSEDRLKLVHVTRRVKDGFWIETKENDVDVGQ